VLKPGGYAVLSDPSGVKEADTFTCGHCQHIVHVKPLADAADSGGLCKVCMKLICETCVDRGTCTPWEQQMERIEARDRFLRSAGL
jgi:hypothetical protein